MIAGKILGWVSAISAFVFAVIWLGVLFSGWVPPADAGQRFWVLVALLSPMGLTLLCGPPLLILNPFK